MTTTSISRIGLIINIIGMLIKNTTSQPSYFNIVGLGPRFNHIPAWFLGSRGVVRKCWNKAGSQSLWHIQLSGGVFKYISAWAYPQNQLIQTLLGPSFGTVKITLHQTYDCTPYTDGKWITWLCESFSVNNSYDG